MRTEHGSGTDILSPAAGEQWTTESAIESPGSLPGRLLLPSLETSLDALMVIDAGGLIQAWNTSAEEMFGYTFSEARGRQVANLIIPPEHRAAHHHGLQRHLEAGTARILNQQIEVEAMRRDGERFPAMLTVTRLPGKGNPLFLGALRDLSRQRSAESERGEIGTRFRSLIEQLPVVVFIDAADVHMTPLYISPQVEQMLGYTQEECLSDPDLWEKCLHPDDREYVLREVIACPHGQPFELEYRLVHRDGRTVWVREETVTIFDDDGEPRYSQGVFIDITEQKQTEERIREAEASYRSLVEQTPAITFRTAPESLKALNYVSPQMRSILGFDPEQCIARPELLLERVHVDDRERIFRAAGASVKSGTAFSEEFRIENAQGEEVWISARAELVHDDTARPRFWQGIMTDITDRRTMEDAYAALRARYRHFAEHANDAIIAINRDGAFLFSNPAFHKLCGYTEEELSRMRLSDIVDPESFDDARAVSRRLLADDVVDAAYDSLVFRNRDGEAIFVEVSASAVRSNQEVIGFQAIIRDVTERRRMEAQLAHQAFFDELTGLPNRARLLDVLHSRLNESGIRDFRALIFLDLDNFKVINDSLGHDVGDRALIEVGSRIQSCLHAEDFIARFGGDEFVILLHNVQQTAASADIARRIVEGFDEPFQIAGREVKITASIGIAEITDDVERPAELLRRADLAMYRSKERGRNRYAVHDVEMDRIALDRLELEADLRRSIERDELALVYQPVVRNDTGEICGAEALVRWVHPERGQLAPDDFIPIAEETGLIVDLDRWVIREAYRQVATWTDLIGNSPFDLSVNISARQLEQPDFVDYIESILTSVVVPASVSLIFEITETAMMRDVEQAKWLLERLHTRGLRVALDDFGMGYSSMAQIRHLPIDYIKIDRHFIGEISDQQEDMIIVSGMIELSRALGLAVVAEGVESADQARLLSALGCAFAQGYYYGPPSTPANFGKLLHALRPTTTPNCQHLYVLENATPVTSVATATND